VRSLIATTRFDLEPLRPEHAREMLPVLEDARLYAFIGGQPPTLGELTEQYERQVAGPAGDAEMWLNWVIRRRSDNQPIGYVQATLLHSASGWSADLAWVVGTDHQGGGAATEATLAVVSELQAHGVVEFRAHVADGNVASVKVAQRVGLVATETLDADGERLYATPRRG
jgi:RimJ/RimL family protein N-acetyltransferase